MATIANLAVMLSANTVAFEAGLARAEDRAASFGGILSKLFAGLAAIGIAEFVKGQFEAIDALGTTAARLGATTEAFVGLGHAANLVDITQEELTTSLMRMNRTLGQAASGSGEAASAFTSLGLDAQTLAQLPVEEAFIQIVDQVNQFSTSAEKAAALTAIFGRGAQSLTTLLEGGGDALRAGIEEAKRLGIAFSAIDAAKIDEADNALKRMRAAMLGIGQELAIAVAPMIEMLARLATEFLVTLREWGPTIIKVAAAVSGFAIGWQAVTIAVALYNIGLRAMIVSTLAWIKAQVVALALSGPKGWAQLAVGAIVAAGAVAAVSGALEDVSAKADGAAAANKKLTAAQQRSLEEGKKIAEVAGKVSSVTEQWTKQAKVLELTAGKTDLTAREMQIFELRADGATGAAIRGLQGINAQLDRMEGAKALADINAKLQDQITFFGLSNDQIAAMKAGMQAFALDGDRFLGVVSGAMDRLRGGIEAATVGNAALGDSAQQALAAFQTAVVGVRAGEGPEQFAERAAVALDAMRASLAKAGDPAAVAALMGQLDAFQARLDAVAGQARIMGAIQAMEVQALERQKELLEIGKKAFEETRTPLEKFEMRLRDLDAALAAGSIGWEAYQRSVGAAVEQLDKVQAMQEIKAPAAIQAGSREAFSAIARFERMGAAGEENPQQRIERILKENQKLQERQARAAEEAVKILRPGIVKPARF